MWVPYTRRFLKMQHLTSLGKYNAALQYSTMIRGSDFEQA